MKIEKDLNNINENEFTKIFGSVFEKSEWIAAETFKLKPFKNPQDLIDKMIKIYESCSINKITKMQTRVLKDSNRYLINIQILSYQK